MLLSPPELVAAGVGHPLREYGVHAGLTGMSVSGGVLAVSAVVDGGDETVPPFIEVGHSLARVGAQQIGRGEEGGTQLRVYSTRRPDRSNPRSNRKR